MAGLQQCIRKGLFGMSTEFRVNWNESHNSKTTHLKASKVRKLKALNSVKTKENSNPFTDLWFPILTHGPPKTRKGPWVHLPAGTTLQLLKALTGNSLAKHGKRLLQHRYLHWYWSSLVWRQALGCTVYRFTQSGNHLISRFQNVDLKVRGWTMRAKSL